MANANVRLALTLCAGAGLGGFVTQALQAQSRPVAYMVAEFEVTDATKFKEYGDATGVQVPAAGGKFIVRGGTTFNVAGDAPKRVVIVQWPNLEKAQTYFESAQYKQLVANRDAGSKFRSFIIEGLDN
jgi:uncharacterized protein (DUF1330 family)